MRKGGWVYIVTNAAFGTLYIGVTHDLSRRLAEHRDPGGTGFTHRYKASRLVHAEWHDDIVTAIQREKSLKRWRRAWKIDLIMERNPGWEDLSTDVP